MDRKVNLYFSHPLLSFPNPQETLLSDLSPSVYSLHLASIILRDPKLLHYRDTYPAHQLPPILELGAGTGFLSMFLSQLGCEKVWATDLGDGDGDGDGDMDGIDNRNRARGLGGIRRGPLDSLIHNLELSEFFSTIFDGVIWWSDNQTSNRPGTTPKPRDSRPT
jgi:hypothetical protein